MLTADTAAAATGCRGNAMNESVAPSNNNNNGISELSSSSAARSDRQCASERSKHRAGTFDSSV